MKRLLLVIFCLFICCIFTGCKDADADISSDVVINMPNDDSVNGYKTESEEIPSYYYNSGTISQTDEDEVLAYYANTSSKKFHKSSCGHAKRIMNDRLFVTENREELINDGYVPCLSCKP